MNESPEALRQTIADTHEDLNRNLEALEAKGEELTDWRAHVEKRPLVMLGLAFVGGALAAAVVSGGRSSRRESGDSISAFAPKRDKPRGQSNDTWHRLRSGIGVAAAGVAMDAISKAMPDVKKHVIDPVRAALRPEIPERQQQWGGMERRFSGLGNSMPQGNGHSS